MTACSRRSIDAHFRGRLSGEPERALRAHLADCASCRGYYERHLVLAAIDPAGKSAFERIGAGLDLSTRMSTRLSTRGGSRGATWGALASMACAAAVALCVVLPMRRRAADDTFTARGASSLGTEPRLFVYRMQPLQKLEGEGASLKRTDDLAFAYANPTSFEHLLVFGVDEHRHVYWYYPAWTDPADDPRAIAVRGGPDVLELPHAIRHDLDGHRLTIHAVFTRDAPSVRAVEAAVAAQASGEAPVPIAGAFEQRVTFEVEP